jgi:hypothetical protein
MGERRIGKMLVLNRDIFMSLVVATLVVLFGVGLYSIFGVKMILAFPLLSFFYKLFGVLAVVYAVVIVAAHRSKREFVIGNYSLLVIYAISLVLLLTLVVIAYNHFEESIRAMAGYIEETFRFPAYSKYFFYLICTSLLLVVVFFLVGLASRTRRIGLDIVQKMRYTTFSSNILDYIYGDEPKQQEVLGILRRKLRGRSCKEEFANTLNAFNINFKGDLKTKTYNLYVELELNKFIRRNLYSWRSSRVFWAIKMLASLNDVNAIPQLKRMLETSNDLVRFELIIGLIRLNQIDFVLDFLCRSSEPVDEYLSNTIICAVKLQHYMEQDYGFLLDSKNEGVRILGLYLISEFNQKGHIQRVSQLLGHPNIRVVNAAMHALMALDYFKFERHVVKAIRTAPERNRLELAHGIRSFFNEESLSWAKGFLIDEPSREVRLAVLRMMCNLPAGPEAILKLYDDDEQQKIEVHELLNSITQTAKK